MDKKFPSSSSDSSNLYLKYTICFCVYMNLVLMLHRVNEPNKKLWNGLGGKIELEESPLDSVKREVLEESNIDISKASNIYFAGIVTWNQNNKNTDTLGMYSFIVDLPVSRYIWKGNRITPEGLLAWKSIDWVSSLDNNEVVENIPHFLPPMLRKDAAADYHFEYNGKQIVKYSVRSIPIEIRSFGSKT